LAKHYKEKHIDDVGRLQVPKYILKMLQVNKGDAFQLRFNVKTKSITFKLQKEDS